MGAGDLFDEVAPLTHGKRTADIVALEESQVLVLSWEHIDRLSRMFPIIAFRLFRNFTGSLSSRLARTDEYKLGSGAG
jgi:CRP-like cAMP-binding protein